jgi:NADPH:quinone reductase-like Zn-dependent oxidoreductase
MKAALCQRFGSPDVVAVGELPTPVPRDDEVLVRVRAATVGVVDSLARRGAPWYARIHFWPAEAEVPRSRLGLRRAG